MCAAIVKWGTVSGVALPKKLEDLKSLKKTLELSLKILKNMEFSSDLVHYLAQVGRAQAHRTEYAHTPLRTIDPDPLKTRIFVTGIGVGKVSCVACAVLTRNRDRGPRTEL